MPQVIKMVAADTGIVIRVRVIGDGRPVLVIPSLGRGVDDFDDVAHALAAQGYMMILPDPRGIGGSSGPLPHDLFDLARDNAAVLADIVSGPCDVVGHAFGNRVARALASLAPPRVGRLVLLAAGGQTVISPALRAALLGSVAEGIKPDAERLDDLKKAFFSADSDPAAWLCGWHPAVAEQQLAASENTDTASWWTAGGASVLLVQAEDDPIAPAGNAEALAASIGDRLTRVQLRRASHAILPEQPRAVTTLIADYLAGECDAQTLQERADRLIV